MSAWHFEGNIVFPFNFFLLALLGLYGLICETWQSSLYKFFLAFSLLTLLVLIGTRKTGFTETWLMQVLYIKRLTPKLFQIQYHQCQKSSTVCQFPPFRFLRFLILSLHFRKFFRLDRCFFFERERASTIPKGYPDLRTIDSLEFRVDGHQFEVLERRWSLLRNFRARYISDWSFGHKGTTIEGTLGVSFIP
ncbi:uncharacterized protein [Nicotiana tomentosiformis]|uniref:uncharacterized protein isoform X2 n=1 Tax=Nicotiana tomentosiformis TaxID=4098 RepID=UPI0008783349|nr:uncharacterized protein LOC104119147 isoform X2 [Nicotiana tomentosiformis]